MPPRRRRRGRTGSPHLGETRVGSDREVEEKEESAPGWQAGAGEQGAQEAPPKRVVSVVTGSWVFGVSSKFVEGQALGIEKGKIA